MKIYNQFIFNLLTTLLQHCQVTEATKHFILKSWHRKNNYQYACHCRWIGKNFFPVLSQRLNYFRVSVLWCFLLQTRKLSPTTVLLSNLVTWFPSYLCHFLFIDTRTIQWDVFSILKNLKCNKLDKNIYDLCWVIKWFMHPGKNVNQK